MALNWRHECCMLAVLVLLVPRLRMTLVQLNYYGNARVTPLKDLLLEAWEDYNMWTKDQKICAPTNRWTPGVVPCFHSFNAV